MSILNKDMFKILKFNKNLINWDYINSHINELNEDDIQEMIDNLSIKGLLSSGRKFSEDFYLWLIDYIMKDIFNNTLMESKSIEYSQLAKIVTLDDCSEKCINNILQTFSINKDKLTDSFS